MAITVDISKRVVLINSFSGVCTRVLRGTVLVWMYHYLLQRVSPDEFASYALVTAVMVAAPFFSSLFTAGISRYVVEAYAQEDENRGVQIISSIFPVLVCVGVVLLAVGWTFSWDIGSFLTVPPEHLRDTQLMMGLLVTDFVIQMVMSPFATAFHVRQKYLQLNLIDLAGETLRIVLLFSLLMGLGARVIWVVVATVVSNLLRVVFTTAMSRRLLPELRLRLATFQWITARQLFSFGIWTTLNQLAGLLYINADIIVLNKLATSSDVVVYKLGLEAYNQLNTLVVATLVTILPVLTSLHARGDYRRMGEGVLRGARYILWMSSFMILPLIVFRRELISLYAGENYLEAADVLTLLLLLFPFMAASFFLAPLSEAKAQLRGLCSANLAINAVRLSAVLYAVKVLELGALGCAVATFLVMTLAHSAILVPMTLQMANVTWQRYVHEVLAKGIAPALFGSLVWLALRLWVGPTSWLSLAICGSIGAVAYVAGLAAFSLSGHERSELFSALRTFKRKTFMKEPGFSEAGN